MVSWQPEAPLYGDDCMLIAVICIQKSPLPTYESLDEGRDGRTSSLDMADGS
jgi:hypothetical protein